MQKNETENISAFPIEILREMGGYLPS